MRRWALAVAAVAALTLTTSGPVARAADEPVAPDPSQLPYVSLGDSYVSAPLVLPMDTTWVPVDCGQSAINYPHLAAQALGLTQFKDVSCGSAQIRDFTQPQDGLPIGGTNAPQFDALTPETRIVTLGIGGNDVDFPGVALSCVRLTGPPLEQPCTPGRFPDGVDVTARDIDAMGDDLAAALQEIHRRSPLADVYVVGYPTGLPDDGVACRPYVPILQEDLPYLVSHFKLMNAELAAQAAANNATYVDIYTSSIGHDVCKLPGTAWVNGLVVVPPSYPLHPNQLGTANSAVVVAQAIRAGSLTPRAATAAAMPATEADGRSLPATGGPSNELVTLGLGLLGTAVALTRMIRRSARQR